jgi:hypothetical protein
MGNYSKKKIRSEWFLRFVSLDTFVNVERIQLPPGISGITVAALHRALPNLTTIENNVWIPITGEIVNVRVSLVTTELAVEVYKYGHSCDADQTFVRWGSTGRVDPVERSAIEEHIEPGRRARQGTNYYIRFNG